MKRRVLSVVLKSAVVVLLLSGSALAERRADRDGDGDVGRGHAYGRDRAASTNWVPEFDPAAAGAIAAIVAGGGVLLARRRKR